MSPVPPKPTTPVKKQSTTDAAGNTTTTEYHAPATGTTATGTNKGLMDQTNAIKQQALGIQSQIQGLGGSPNNPPAVNIGQRIAGQTQNQADVQANLPQYNGGQVVSGNPATSPTFPGVVGQTIQTAQTGSPVASQASAGLLGMGTQPSDAYTQAVKNLQDFRNKYSQALTGVELGGTDIAFKTGAGAVLARQAAAQESALQQAVTNTLQGQQQQIGALTAAGGIGTTAQGLQQSGLLGAAGLAPEALRFGAFGNAGGGQAGASTLSYNPQTDANTLAKQVISMQVPFTDAVNALGYAGSIGRGLLTSAIAAQGGDLTKIQAQQSAIQSNIQTVGTAQKNAANAGYAGAIQQRADADANYSRLTGISSQLTGTLANWSNSGVLTDVNSAVNKIAGKLSSADYQQFVTALGNTQAAYQGILGSSGVTPTKADQDAMAALDPSKSASTIVAALNQLSKDAHALLVEPAYSKVTEYESQLGI
jgi:hypothetical protein